MRKHIPNLITCCNALCGALAVFMIMNNNGFMAAWLVLLAMIFDFFDGFMARLLHVKSDLGKELDSLADMVSFGVVPTLLARLLIQESFTGEESALTVNILSYLPVLMVAFSAYRLAKFNLDTRQTFSFIGVPTPANALFWVGLVFAFEWQHKFSLICWGNSWVLAGCVILLSWLLVAELPMFSLKFHSFKWEENKIRYLYFLTLILLFVLLQETMLSFIIPLYILFNGVNFLWVKMR